MKSGSSSNGNHGEQKRHRLSRAGNRRINQALHTMAIVQIRQDTACCAYLRPSRRCGQDADGDVANARLTELVDAAGSLLQPVASVNTASVNG
jgi:Transposase IS116/IS110/IS902 family